MESKFEKYFKDALEQNDIEQMARLTDKISVVVDTEADIKHLCTGLFQLTVNLENALGLQFLLSRDQVRTNINVHEPNSSGVPPAYAVVQSDNVSLLSQLVEDWHIDPFAYSPAPVSAIEVMTIGRHSVGDGISLFDAACRDGKIACVRYLLKLLRYRMEDRSSVRGHDEEVCERLLYRALVISVEQNQARIVEQLLSSGADVNFNHDNDIGTAVHVAARYNSVDCLDLLLARGANIDSVATDRLQTPLMIAAQYNHSEITERLLSWGADVNMQTSECSSALIVACHYGHKECVDALLAYGANTHLKNPWDYSALYMGTDTPEILQRLLSESVDEVNEKCGEREEVPLHLATVIGSCSAVRTLLNVGADINKRTIYNENSLWLAAWKGHEDVARLLIQNNIELDPYSNGCEVYVWHYLPIEVAIGLELYRLMKMLLIAGCKLQNTKYYSSYVTNPVNQSKDADELMQVEDSNDEQNLVVHPGYDFRLPQYVRLRPEVFDYIKYNTAELQWFKHFVENPTTLKNATRLAIRKWLGTSLWFKVDRLPLPSAIKRYLMMDDLDEL